jgi:hypothetical protein
VGKRILTTGVFPLYKLEKNLTYINLEKKRRANTICAERKKRKENIQQRQ